MAATVAPDGRPRDAEVHDERVVLGVHHDVGGLQIAMHDAGLVRGGEPRRDLPGDRQRAIDRQPALALQDRREIRSLDVRHRDVLDAVDLAEIVDADDVLVGDLAGEQQLALEALLERLRPPPGRRGIGPDDLDRDRDLEHLVPGLIDGAHAADAEQPDDVVAGAEILADAEVVALRRALSHRAARGREPGLVRVRHG